MSGADGARIAVRAAEVVERDLRGTKLLVDEVNERRAPALAVVGDETAQDRFRDRFHDLDRGHDDRDTVDIAGFDAEFDETRGLALSLIRNVDVDAGNDLLSGFIERV